MTGWLTVAPGAWVGKSATSPPFRAPGPRGAGKAAERPAFRMSSRRVPKVRQLADFWRSLARRLAKLRQLANFRARDGRVNVSPKGLDSLRVLGPPG